MLNTTQMIIVFVIIFLLMNYSCPSITKENFDADCYLNAFPDVKKAGLDALTHYNSYGKQEIESGNRKKPNCDLSLSTDKGYILPATDFDCECYLNTYSDLKAAFGSDCAKALQHYNTNGKQEIAEGRRAKLNCGTTQTASSTPKTDFKRLIILSPVSFLPTVPKP